jgi:hypothetical protein
MSMMFSRVFQHLGRPVLHLAAATIFSSISAALLGGIAYRFAMLAGAAISAGSPLEFFFEHIVTLAFVSGVLAGWVNNAKFPHVFARWVWLIPALLLAFRMLAWHEYSVFESPLHAVGSHFFGHGCRPPYSMAQLALSGGTYCFDTLKFTAPFCSSVGYAAGAVAELTFHKKHEGHVLT